jgi:general stress protein 26
MASDESPNWEDLSSCALSEADKWDVINGAKECHVAWVTKDGAPVVATMCHAVLDGQIYLTCTIQRPKVKAMQRDPRIAISFSNYPGQPPRAVGIKARVELSTDRELRRRFHKELARRLFPDDSVQQGVFYRHMDSPNRVIIKVNPIKFFTFDSAKLRVQLD